MADWPEPGTETHDPPEDQREGLAEAAPWVGLPGTPEDTVHATDDPEHDVEQ